MTLCWQGSELDASEQVRRWIESPVQFWESCATRHASPVPLQLGSIGPVALIYEPDQVRQVFLLPTDAFECRQYNEHYRYVMGGESILLQDGAKHKRQRRLIGPLLRHDILRAHEGKIREAVSTAISKWPEGEPVAPRRDLQEVTFHIITQMLFGSVKGTSAKALIDAYSQSVLRQTGSWGPWRNFSRLQPQIRDVLASEITERRACPHLAGSLTNIVQAHDGDGALLGIAECEDHVFTLLITGVDSTAISLTWALHWLSRDAEVLSTLQQELSAHDRSNGGSLTDLRYLDAVYRETLRMYPIIPTPSGRRLTRDISIGGVLFEAGTTLIPCTYLVHRRPDLYPEPDRFRPERFLEREYANYEYFPFGGGGRSCIGETLAEWEFKIAIAAMLDRYMLQTTSDPPLQPVRHGTLLAPPDDFRIVVRKRQDAAQ